MIKAFLYGMKFRTHSDAGQALLAQEIRATASQHQATPLQLWRTALEQVNPEVITVAPYCMREALLDVLDRLDIATS